MSETLYLIVMLVLRTEKEIERSPIRLQIVSGGLEVHRFLFFSCCECCPKLGHHTDRFRPYYESSVRKLWQFWRSIRSFTVDEIVTSKLLLQQFSYDITLMIIHLIIISIDFCISSVQIIRKFHKNRFFFN